MPKKEVCIYINGQLVHTVIGSQVERPEELLDRVKKSIQVVVHCR